MPSASSSTNGSATSSAMRRRRGQPAGPCATGGGVCAGGAVRAGSRGVGRERARRGRVGRRRLLPGRLAGGDAADRCGRDLALQRGPRGAREIAGGRVALLRRLRHRRADHDVERRRHSLGQRAGGGRRVVEVRVHLRQLGVARERRPAGQRVEQHRAERVDVGAGVGMLAADLLGRGEVGRADEVAGAREAGAGRGVLGQPEVGQVGVLLPLLRDQHVGRLDVAVHEPAAVRRVERAGDLPDDPHRALGAEPAATRRRASAGRSPRRSASRGRARRRPRRSRRSARRWGGRSRRRAAPRT